MLFYWKNGQNTLKALKKNGQKILKTYWKNGQNRQPLCLKDISTAP